MCQTERGFLISFLISFFHHVLGVITKLRNTKRSGRNVKKVYKPDPIGYKPFINPFLTTHYDYSSEEDENIPNMPKRSRADVAKLEAEYRKLKYWSF